LDNILPPIVALVLIATVDAFKFNVVVLSMVGVPEDPTKFISFTPKFLSAIAFF